MEESSVGDTIEGRVVNVDYGAFLELTPGVEQIFVYVSEISWSNQPVNSREFFKVGDTHKAKIMTKMMIEKCHYLSSIFKKIDGLVSQINLQKERSIQVL